MKVTKAKGLMRLGLLAAAEGGRQRAMHVNGQRRQQRDLQVHGDVSDDPSFIGSGQ
jgi:hypothetical protein